MEMTFDEFNILIVDLWNVVKVHGRDDVGCKTCFDMEGHGNQGVDDRDNVLYHKICVLKDLQNPKLRQVTKN